MSCARMLFRHLCDYARSMLLFVFVGIEKVEEQAAFLAVAFSFFSYFFYPLVLFLKLRTALDADFRSEDVQPCYI